MKNSLIVTAISLSAMFGYTATAQNEVGLDDQFLLAANRGGNSNHSSTSNNSSNTGRGALQKSNGGSDTRGSRGSNSNSGSNERQSKANNNPVRNNPQPQQHESHRNPHRHGNAAPPPPPEPYYGAPPAPVDDYVVVTTTSAEPQVTYVYDDKIAPVMADAFFGLNLSAMGENDLRAGFCAGIKGEFGLPRSGYYGSIGARYSKQNFTVAYGNDYFPDDLSDVSIKTLQIPVTLAGYRMALDEDASGGIGIGLIYQRGLGGTTESEYHDDWDFKYTKERKKTFDDGLMSRNDVLGMIEAHIRFMRVTVTAEASISFGESCRFPNKDIYWECSDNLSPFNYQITIGYRLY